MSDSGDPKQDKQREIDAEREHYSEMTTLMSDEALKHILDEHAKWYIKRTVKFMQEGKEPSFVTGTNEQDHKSLVLIKQQQQAAVGEAVTTLHKNIDVTFNLIERIQPGYMGSPQIDARDLQKLLCEYEDEQRTRNEKARTSGPYMRLETDDNLSDSQVRFDHPDGRTEVFELPRNENGGKV